MASLNKALLCQCNIFLPYLQKTQGYVEPNIKVHENISIDCMLSNYMYFYKVKILGHM